MSKHTIATTDAEIDAALAARRHYEEEHGPEPSVARIEYLEPTHILIVHLSNGLRYPFAVENLQGLENATPEQLRNYEIDGLGYGFGFPDLDADFYLPPMLQNVFGNKRWMAELGSHGGRVKSDAKAAAARANGMKGGRPRKAEQVIGVHPTREGAIEQARDSLMLGARETEGSPIIRRKVTGHQLDIRTPNTKQGAPQAKDQVLLAQERVSVTRARE